MPELSLEDKETLPQKESGNWTGQRVRKSLGPQKQSRYNSSGTGQEPFIQDCISVKERNFILDVLAPTGHF